MKARWLALPLGAAALFVWAPRPSAQQTRRPDVVPDPSFLRIEYRTAGYFPKDFPLQGTVRLLSEPFARMGERTRIRFEYIVGDLAVETGSSIDVWKHFTSDLEQFQTTDPDTPAYFGVQLPPGVQGTTIAHTNWVQRNTPVVFPYRRTAEVRITQGRLKKGDRVVFDMGGKAGVRMQHYAEKMFNFRVVILREGKVLGYGGDAPLEVIGGPLRKLRVQAPSVVKPGEKFSVEVAPMDEWVSLAANHKGLTLRIAGGDVTGGAFVYDTDLAHYIARDVVATREGTSRITVRTADGKFEATSNPVWVEREPTRGVYYGELHQHTYLHDGRGVYEELYVFARRVGLLDFGAVTPHHMPMSVTGPSFYLDKRYPSENWPDLMKATKAINGWQDFVSILGYEYSVGTQLGGHHNIFYNADQAKTTMQLDPSEPMAPISKMLKTLQLVRTPTLVIPHIGGGPPDWSHPTDPRIERLFEIASVHGVFEESWHKHLQAGVRLAASAAGDTHTVSMGNAYPGLIYAMTNALTGVYATGKSRQQIWDGLYSKRTFATTGNRRILVDFALNGEPMGGEVASSHVREARLSARVSGTEPLLRVELLKNGKVIHSVHPLRDGASLVRVVWGDNIYQRRSTDGVRPGELRASQGSLKLVRPLHLDQAFEEVRQDGGRIVFRTTAFSNDRDGFLVDVSGASGDLLFRLEDPEQTGVHEFRVPITDLQRDGQFAGRDLAERVKHPYMERMGVPPAFFLNVDLLNARGPMDTAFEYVDREAVKPGDYYYLRIEQLDTNKAWASPVWIN